VPDGVLATPGVSVLTPVHRPIGRYLSELHASLDAQHGVDWEWVVQVDGGSWLLRRIPWAIRADPRVRIEVNGRWLGQAVTRNLALARVRFPLLQTVDADDLLLPGALAATAAALDRETDLGLAFGWTWELAADGRCLPAKNPYPPGRLLPGILRRDWEQRGGSCSIVVASAMWRAACVRAQGGWPATVAGTDVLLLLAVASLHPTRCVDHDSYLYRSHPDQAHRSPLRFATRPHYQALARGMLAARDELGLAPEPRGVADLPLAAPAERRTAPARAPPA
jgi:glycosyltransferase involved in cell wall biosynthesis